MGHNTVEATKNICCTKYEGTVDQSRITRWFKKFCLDWKNLNYQTRSGKPKNMDSKAMLEAIEVNLESIRRVQHLTVQNG